MFNRGISQLLEALPDFEGLDATTVKRLLTSAYIESLDLATLAEGQDLLSLAAALRRLVTSLEVHAVLVPHVDQEARRACSFVAAESLNLLLTLPTEAEPREPFAAFGSRARYARVEAALLYLIAAFDANAVMAVRGVRSLSSAYEDEVEASASEWALHEILALIRLSAARSDPFPELPSAVRDVQIVRTLRVQLWQRIGQAVRRHLLWLRLQDDHATSGVVDELASLSALLETEGGGPYADLAHLVRLLRLACDGMQGRALRGVEPPPEDPTLFRSYLERRCADKPLLWPSAEAYRENCLPGPSVHAAVAMPTGAGKSGVAELAVAQALSSGWVLYLAPTRALVAQVRRDLRRALGPNVAVREFLGGAEFTALADETLERDPGQTVLVMTPEKCSLALRQSPDAFQTLALCVFDECHLISEAKGRGVLAELVVAQIMANAPAVKLLMQSALLANPEDIAAWLERATSERCMAIREPWRPTRTLRAVAGFDAPELQQAIERASGELEALPQRRRHLPFDAPLNILVSLQGAWATEDPADYALAKTTLHAPLRVSRTERGIRPDGAGYVNPATGSVTQGLVEAGYRVLAFIPGNKHHNFTVARDLPGFGNERDASDAAWIEIENYLALADYELGTASLLRDLLQKGVAVHTSAMLQDERRASERAYEGGIAKAIFATATLAQGLNLPATAVVIGGIDIGFDPALTPRERAARQQSQLLNAVGRAGRPYVAARSLAVVLPNDLWTLGPEDTGHEVRTGAAPFLEMEDAASDVFSQLAPIVREALNGTLSIHGLGAEGSAAFAFLPLRADNTEALEILDRTYAMARRPDPREHDAEVVAEAMTRLGEGLLQDQHAPGWLVDVAYDSGLSLRQVAALWDQVRLLRPDGFPAGIPGWAARVIQVLKGVPYEIVAEMICLSDLTGTKMRALAEDTATDRDDAWGVMGELVRQWLAGISLTELAETAVRSGSAGNGGRGSGNPLPKVIGLTEQLINFTLTRIAGAIAHLVNTGAISEPELGWQLSREDARALEVLSLAIRAGCGDEASLAWWRFGGLRHRRLAHLAARLLPPPNETLGDDDAAARWIGESRNQLLDTDFFMSEEIGLAEDELGALVATTLLAGT